MDSKLPMENNFTENDLKKSGKFLAPGEKTMVIYTDNSVAFEKACEDLRWNHCTSAPHRSETSDIAERQ